MRTKKVSGWMRGLCGTLETARRKWCTEEDGREAHRQQLTAEVAMNLLKSLARRQAFEARWAEVKDRHKKRLHEGNFVGAIGRLG